MSDVHWSGIRARRLSSHHGEFCKFFCSQTSRQVDFFSDDGAHSGEQLLNMIGMCSAFSISNKILSIGGQNGLPATLFQCVVHSLPPVTLSVVASAHNPIVPAAANPAKVEAVKLWIVSQGEGGVWKLDDRKLADDTEVTFTDAGHGLPSNIFAGCRYQVTGVHVASFQLLRPDFRTLFVVDSGSVKAVKTALDSVRVSAVGQPMTKNLKDLLNVDPGNHEVLKSQLQGLKSGAVDADASPTMKALLSADAGNHEALNRALEDVRLGLVGQQGGELKHPGLIDFRNKLCHNLLTLERRHFDALIACARAFFPGIRSICALIGKEQELKHAEQSLAEIERIVLRDVQVATLTEQERETLNMQHALMLEEHDRLKLQQQLMLYEHDQLKQKLGRKFDSFAPCLKKDIQDQLSTGDFTLSHSAVR
jgi:hypothetical protein